MPGRRRFGNMRKLPSDRWQASYLDPDGVRRPGPETFATKREAEQWLNYTETQLLQGNWRNPDDARVTLSDFGARWVRERPGLRPRTLDLYRSLFRLHIEPRLGALTLIEVTPAAVRSWRSYLLANSRSETVTAKAYRLLRAIMMTAVDDGIVTRNPCRITGAGSESAPERPVLTVAQVVDLGERLPKPYGLMAVTATFGSLRWGEVTALRRCDVDTTIGTVWVRSAFSRTYNGRAVRGPVKSRAGVRAVALPTPIAVNLAEHLDAMEAKENEALIFPGDKGGPLSRNNFNGRVSWTKHVAAIGLPGLHFHDLRHTGNTFAAESGATLRDLMSRMGHDSMRAALIYQHRTQGGDQRIARAMEDLLKRHDDHDEDPDNGASGAPVPAS